MKQIKIILILMCFAQVSFAQSAFVDSVTHILDSAHKVCGRDGGELWHHELWGSVFITDSKTGEFVSNIDTIPYSKIIDNYFVGRVPDSLKNGQSPNLGKNVVSYTYYEDRLNDNAIEDIVHDLFHVLQRKINIHTKTYAANHLANEQSRIYIRLEWDYLLKAIEENEQQTKIAYIDTAIFMRNYRRSLYSGADTIENKFEILEGTAQFTGVHLTYKTEQLRLTKIEQFKERIEALQDYTRNHGYLTGLLYCSLLSQFSESWTKEVNINTDLATLLKHYSHASSITVDIKKFKVTPSYQRFKKEEDIIASKKDKEKREISSRFVENNILNISMKDASFKFNPTTFLHLDSLGTYCPYFMVSCAWGELSVQHSGGIFSNDWQTLIIPAVNICVNDSLITNGEDWNIQLTKGWELVRDQKGYNLVQVKETDK